MIFRVQSGKKLQRAEKIYTDTVCDVCDKYEVCSRGCAKEGRGDTEDTNSKEAFASKNDSKGWRCKRLTKIEYTRGCNKITIYISPEFLAENDKFINLNLLIHLVNFCKERGIVLLKT